MLANVYLVSGMEFVDVIMKRRSIRGYKPDPISNEDLKFLLEAARLAPSWKNQQCWEYIIVKNEKRRIKIAESRPESKDWISQAPVIIVACAQPQNSGHMGDKDYYMTDIGISFEHLILAASDRGLGTCWVGEFDEKMVKEILDIPANVRVVAFTPVGYPAKEKGEIHRRKPLQEFCYYEKYGQKE